ncbi:MAG: Unknown protein [uncultured Sulfurovum sp.]|uniref:Uncharacterized protein n=1 Tax=uncultured Sulfurovum sp. TaxID=269237 RepID=A0A6S6TMJ3_9BACT|nr:MAG: Unknown protein [uncultured Sulfurovum sp.]
MFFTISLLFSCTSGCLDSPVPQVGAIAVNQQYIVLDNKLSSEYKKLQELINDNIKIDEDIIALTNDMIQLDTKKSIDTEFRVFLKKQKNILKILENEN